jgi:hypothetical protein
MNQVSQTIMRWDVVEQMDSGAPFDITYITMDRRRGTGGEIRRRINWAKVKGTPAETRLPGQFNKVASVAKNPQHLDHKTMNIFNPADPRDHIAKVHWRLITHFNGLRVIG